MVVKKEPSIIRAASIGRADWVRERLVAGIDPNTKGRNGYRPLHVAVNYGSIATVRSLLASRYIQVDARNVSGITPLHLVTSPKITWMLLEKGASPNARDCTGRTPLFKIENLIDIGKILLEHGADVNARDNNGWTPLMAAIRLGSVEMVKFLSEHDADWGATSKFGTHTVDDLLINADEPVIDYYRQHVARR